MRIVIGVEFDIEPEEISDVLQPIEVVAYGLGCVQVLIHHNSGSDLEVGPLVVIPSNVFWPVPKGGAH